MIWRVAMLWMMSLTLVRADLPCHNEQLGYGYDAAGNLTFRTNDALVETFAINSLNQPYTITGFGPLTVSGALPAPAASLTVNGTSASLYADQTFAATNLATNGVTTLTMVATNLYGVAASNVMAAPFLPLSLGYNANGNSDGNGTVNFYYDAENRLDEMLHGRTWNKTFEYDGLGRRRVMDEYRINAGFATLTNEIHYIYDGALVIQEIDTNNNSVVTYTRGTDLSLSLQGAGGIGGLLARTDTNGSTYYHADGSGNVTALMDGNQNIVARYEYDAFGRMINKQGSMANANHYRFSSKEYDMVTGLYYYGARFYDPVLQRFLNRDPIGELGGFNLYESMENDPVNNVDLWGLQVPSPMNMVVGFGPGYGQSVADYNNQVQSAANTSLPMITGAFAATATGGLAGPALVGTGLMTEGSVATGFATGALAASAGDAAAQATSIALGNQQNFDTGQLAAVGMTGGLLGAAGNALGSALKSNCLEPPTRGQLIRTISSDQKDLLRQLFGTGPAGAQKALAAIQAGGQIPSGLTTQTLQTYQQIAQMSINEGIDSIGTQAARLQLINSILNQ